MRPSMLNCFIETNPFFIPFSVELDFLWVSNFTFKRSSSPLMHRKSMGSFSKLTQSSLPTGTLSSLQKISTSISFITPLSEHTKEVYAITENTM